MKRSSLLAGALAALAVVLPATAVSAAQRPTIIFPQDGIKVVGHEARLGGKAAKTARFWVGKRLDTTCERVSHRPQSGFFSANVRPTRFTGKVINLGATSGKDYCVVDHPTPDGQGEPVAFVALTPAGAAWIEELQLAIALISSGPDIAADQPVPTTEAVVTGNPKVYVALPAPDAAPPIGKIGYWSDGAQHYVLAIVAPTSKRRLFAEFEGDGVVRTNILEYTSAIGL